MSPFDEREDRGNPTEHLRTGVSLFMAQCEDKVRQKNVEIEALKAEREKAFSSYIGERLENLTNEAFYKGVLLGKLWMALGTLLGVFIGLGVEHYAKW